MIRQSLLFFDGLTYYENFNDPEERVTQRGKEEKQRAEDFS